MRKFFIAGLMALLQSPYFAQGTSEPINTPAPSKTGVSAVAQKDSALFASLQKTLEKLTGELGILNRYMKEKTGEKEIPKVLCAKVILKPQPLVVVRAELSGKEEPVLSDRMKHYKSNRKRKRKIRKHVDEVRYKMVFVEKVVLEIKDSRIERIWVRYRNNVNGYTAAKTCIAEKTATDENNMALRDLNKDKFKLKLNANTNPDEFIYLNEFLEYEDYFKGCDKLTTVIELNTETHEKAINQ